MVKDDLLAELRKVYEYWVQVKHTVSGWGAEYGWLVELTVVGFIGLIIVLLILLSLLTSIDSASEQRRERQAAPKVDAQDTYMQLDWKGFLALVAGALSCGVLFMLFTSWLR